MESLQSADTTLMEFSPAGGYNEVGKNEKRGNTGEKTSAVGPRRCGASAARGGAFAFVGVQPFGPCSGRPERGGRGAGQRNPGAAHPLGARRTPSWSPILEEYARDAGVRIEMTYQGSLDIMRALGQEDLAYDAVWPASSLWLNVGDTGHRIKHAESISITPVVFGIQKSLAESWALSGARSPSRTCWTPSARGPCASA